MYYFDKSNIDLKTAKMYHIDTASKIVYLLSHRALLENPDQYFEDTEKEKQYFDYFKSNLISAPNENKDYVSFTSIIDKINEYEEKVLDFNNINQKTCFNKKEIYTAAYLLLLCKYPKNIDEKYYKFKIEKTKKGWQRCVERFKSIIGGEENSFVIEHAMYLIMLCILPDERDLYFTQDFIADTSAGLSFYSADIENFDFDKDIIQSDSDRTIVKTNIHKFLQEIGHTIKGYKVNKNYKFPIDVTIILIAYFSFNNGQIYRNIMNNKKSITTTEEKDQFIEYGIKLMGRLFRYYFCYNERIHCFPYEPVSQKICSLECTSLDMESCASCLYYSVYSSYSKANIIFDKKINNLEEEISKEISNRLQEVTLKLRDNDPYFGFLRLTPDKLIDYPENDICIDLYKVEEEYSSISYYERLYFLEELKLNVKKVFDDHLKKMKEFQDYKDFDIDYVDFLNCQLKEDNHYIEKFVQNPKDRSSKKQLDEILKMLKQKSL